MENNKRQLYCFTHAGGNADFFNIIENSLSEIQIIKIDYSGHGSRHREPLYSDFDELGDDLFCQFVKTYKNNDYALFGYSMGSIALIEVLKRIIKGKVKLPKCVFLAAHEPCTKYELRNYSDEKLDEWVKNTTLKFGAIPNELRNNSLFWRLYLPLFRNDYNLISKYDFDSLDLLTYIPAIIFYSESDTPINNMKIWDNYFIGKNEYHCYSGSHFFIKDHYKEISEIINSKMS